MQEKIISEPTLLQGDEQPNAGISQLPGVLDTMSNTIAERSVEYLKNQAIQLLNRCLEYQQFTPNKDANLPILMKRYNLEKSRLSELIDWYAELAWYKRYLGAAAFVTVSALVGAIFNLAAVLTLLSMSIQYFIGQLIMDHYEITSRRDERFCSDIVMMEKKQAENIEILVDVAKKVNNILVELCAKNLQSAENITVFQEKISALETQTHRFLAAIRTVDEAQKLLATSNEKIAGQIQVSHCELEEARLEITRHAVDINTSTSNPLVVNEELFSEVHVTDIHAKFQDMLDVFARFEANFQAQQKAFREGVDETTDVNPTESAKETLVLKRNTDNILAKSDDLLARARSRHAGRTYSEGKKKSAEQTTASILARVAVLQAGLENKENSANGQNFRM